LIYWVIIQRDGQIQFLELCSLVLFAILFAWIAFSFSIATLGFLVTVASLLRRKSPQPEEVHDYAIASQQRTAVLMPVYNESPE